MIWKLVVATPFTEVGLEEGKNRVMVMMMMMMLTMRMKMKIMSGLATGQLSYSPPRSLSPLHILGFVRLSS